MKKWTSGVTTKTVRIMKKLYKALLCTFCASALFSCVQEEFEPTDTVVPEGYTLQTFSVETQSTKTTVEINADGTHGNTLWAKGDQLAIFWDGGKGTADLKGEGGSTTGSFTGAVPQGKKVNYAVYPSKIASSVEGTTVNITIPDQQEGTFSAGNIAVAEVGEDNSISFNNLNAFLCIQLISEDITKITIESVGGEPLVGVIPVTFEENDGKRLAVSGTVTDGAAKVTMTKAAGETGRYYVSIVPGVTHSEGLLMTYYKGEEVSGTYQLNQRLAPQANVIYNFGEFEPDFNYYVTRNGAGNKTGVTWRDAISISQMVEMVFEGSNNKNQKVLDDKLNGATFHIEEGEYELAESDKTLRFANDELVKLTFIGSYDSETHKRDLENSRTSFTGNNSHCILNINCNNAGNADMDITFDGIGFVNGKLGGGNDGALYSDCSEGDVSITLQNGYMNGNENLGTDGSGGAMIIMNVNKFRAVNTVFANNKGVRAPVVHCSNTDAEFINCTFEGNEATGDAGVAYLPNGGKTAVFTDCEFKGNKAKRFGAVYHSEGRTTFNNCVFADNQATGDTGALEVMGGTVIVNGGKFTGNKAETGGAIMVDDGFLEVKDAEIIGNSSTSNGGAVWSAVTCSFVRCTIKDNTGASGGAFRVNGGNLQIYGCEIEGNIANGGGGAIHMAKPAGLVVSDSRGKGTVFRGNRAKYEQGGAVYILDEGLYSFDHCHFDGNSATRAAAVYVDGPADMYMNACTFIDNTISGADGTAIYVAKAATIGMNNCTIADGSYATGSTGDTRTSWVNFDIADAICISNCTFIGRSRSGEDSETNGGLVRMWFDNDADVHFINNIIVDTGDDNMHAFCDLDKSGFNPSINMHYTKYSSFRDLSACRDHIESVESPASSGFEAEDFSGLTWNADQCCWYWDGTMTGGGNTNMITKDAFVSAMNEALPDFKSWLESNGKLLLDQGGRYRGEDRWWPGAYQDGIVAAKDVTVTTFNLRGSNMDEAETSREWANRKTGVFAWFNENQPPFVCSQECSEVQRNEILDNCSAYGAVYYAGSSSWLDQFLGRDTDAPVVTFYKKDEVTVHSSGTFWLVDGAPTSPTKAPNQNQERCATWMKCTYKDKKMVVLNTHISYRTKNEDTGTSEAMQALRESEMGVIKTWVTNSSNYNPEVDGPVVLVGDFNVDLGNSVFTEWRHNNADDGFYNARDTMWEIDKDACDTGRTFNNWGTENGQQTIDHQFYKGFSSVSSYSVDREPYAGVTYLSDHWPLSVVYEF